MTDTIINFNRHDQVSKTISTLCSALWSELGQEGTPVAEIAYGDTSKEDIESARWDYLQVDFPDLMKGMPSPRIWFLRMSSGRFRPSFGNPHREIFSSDLDPAEFHRLVQAGQKLLVFCARLENELTDRNL